MGDVVHIPGGETHWHGGTSTTMMAHQAISLGSKSKPLFCDLKTHPNVTIETSWHEELDQREYEEAHNVAT